MTKTEFQRLIEKNIPDMAQYPDSVKRLLKFSKHFDGSLYTKDSKDAYDVASPAADQMIQPQGEEPEVYGGRNGRREHLPG